MPRRGEFASASRVTLGAPKRPAEDSEVALEALSAGSEFSEDEGLDAADARGPAVDTLDDPLSPLSAKAVPVDDAKAKPIPNAIDKALNWPM